jgi:hypothetical protein
MKRTSLSKSVRTIGLIGMLAIVVIPNIPKTVQAQSPADYQARAKVCDRVTKENAQEYDGGYYLEDFKGLNLTDRQKKAEAALNKQAEAKRSEIYQGSISVADMNRSLSFSSLPGVSIPPNIQAAIQETLNRGPKMDQAATLNQKFGKYGIFVGSYITYLTPAQQKQLDQIGTNFYRQVQALMTPKQLPQYLQNLSARRPLRDAREPKEPISAYPALGKISDKIPTGRFPLFPAPL